MAQTDLPAHARLQASYLNEQLGGRWQEGGCSLDSCRKGGRTQDLGGI